MHYLIKGDAILFSYGYLGRGCRFRVKVYCREWGVARAANDKEQKPNRNRNEKEAFQSSKLKLNENRAPRNSQYNLLCCSTGVAKWDDITISNKIYIAYKSKYICTAIQSEWISNWFPARAIYTLCVQHGKVFTDPLGAPLTLIYL